MPRLIFTSRYMKPSASRQKSYFMRYIATRAGVENVPNANAMLDATKKQSDLINKLITDFPDTKNMHEYADYISAPNRINATEFITRAIEDNADHAGGRSSYMDYIANRPRVEKIGTHGLFTDAGVPVVLNQAINETANHPGNVWINVLSIRNEDAERLGFDNAQQWMNLIRGKRSQISENFKIPLEDLKWYASFHNESHHPHVHLVVYSKNPKKGYLTEDGIEKLRSEFAREIFKDDLIHIYIEQTNLREEINEQAMLTLQTLAGSMRSGTEINNAFADNILLLAERLKNIRGKKVYGYLNADIKAIINRIIDELAKTEAVAKTYAAWYEMKYAVLNSYTDKMPDPFPLSQQKELSKIRQIVIDEAMLIANGTITFELYEAPADMSDEYDDTGEGDNTGMENLPYDAASEPDVECDDIEYNADWTKEYKKARKFLFGAKGMEPDFENAYELFMDEAENGNALAMHDLGRMFMDGLGRKTDTAAAHEWYAKSLAAFIAAEKTKPKPYLRYRIGRFHYAGLGTDVDYEKAAEWFESAARFKHKYAQYSLAGMYYKGQGVINDYEKAFELYQKSAKQGNAYAAYEVAKMLRDGISTPKDDSEAARYFKIAFNGFVAMEKEGKDDKLMYRIGQMLFTGSGTEKDINEAVGYFEGSAKIGNIYAQYMLAKIYMQPEYEYADMEKALKWLEKSAAGNNPMAQYALGKIYLNGDNVMKDIGAAVKWLTAAAEQGNEYAQYALGKLYLNGEDVQKDTDTAVIWLTAAADQGSQYAQYILGKLYYNGKDIAKDTDTAVIWLKASAEQGNQFAQYILGKIYLMGDGVSRDKEEARRWFALSADQGNEYARFFLDNMDRHHPFALQGTIRLFHHMSRIFRDNTIHTKHQGRMDSKAQRKEREKKIALAHAHDDYAPEQAL